ncbi:MAG: hypothetical protein CLLPBCKN_005986 [Chroococcidiopsis cubana SAG 39.79]|nr:hypothetical protein [Chroococcidiopsis cubana]MDZ4876551.1 hypothetical protein [Chroococcidiopsis cubana SAG 39.79]
MKFIALLTASFLFSFGTAIATTTSLDEGNLVSCTRTPPKTPPPASENRG